MIVKNEERFLAQCLSSALPFVDEINIVDTGSTDRTVEIAERFGARITHCEWRNDFAWARNQSLAMANKRWILQLDADEELLPESHEALESLKNAPAQLTGVWVRCLNSSDRYKGGGTTSHAIVRIFPNTPRIRFSGAIHEFPSADGAALSIPAVGSPIKIRHHGYLNDVVSARDKYARNMEIIEQALRSEPDEAFHWYNLGMTAHLGGDQQRAATAFERMWELCLRSGMRAFTPNGLQMLADVYSEHLEQPEKGLRYAQECLQRAPRYANAHFSAGKAYFLMKRYDEARAMYERAIEDGKFADAQFVVDDEVAAWKAQCEIGSTYAEEGRDALALEWFERGLANRPAIQPLRINRAHALERLGRLCEAEEAFASLYADFGDELSIVNYVNYLLRHKQREAVELIQREHQSVSQAAATAMLLAATFVTQRNGWGDGESLLEAAQRISPDNADVQRALRALHDNRGEAGALIAQAHEALSAGHYVQALDISERGMIAFPRDARFARCAAFACARMERKAEALTFAQAVTDADCDSSLWFLRAVLLRECGQPREALEALAHVLAHESGNLDALLLKASLLETLGDVSGAESALLQASPQKNQRAALELATLYLRHGRAGEAKALADRVLA